MCIAGRSGGLSSSGQPRTLPRLESAVQVSLLWRLFLESRQLFPRALYSVGKHNNSTRVDEGRKCRIILAIKTKARTVVGRGGGYESAQ